MIGMILGNRYEILKEIGSGGMANVYLAHCRTLNRDVAVKVLKPEFANDREFLGRFIKEAQAAAAINSPNIVNVYDVGHDGDTHYIVMEYVKGQTLKEYIEKNGMISWQHTVEYAIQICKALDKAHKHGIVHRDIKPQNIILTNDGVLKVTDFGIARGNASNDTLNMGESTMGSVHYFSPEQARGGYTDAKSDIYSLGVVMYELITGRLPFDGDTPIAIAIKHIQQPPVNPKEYNVSIPLAVESIILKAMSKEQGKRYQSAEEMLTDLYAAQVMPDVVPQINPHSATSDTIKLTEDDQKEILKHETELKEEEYQNYRRHQNGNNTGKNKKVKTVDEDAGSTKKAVLLAILTAFLILGIISVSALALLGGCGKSIEVPDLVGEMYDDVVKEYKDEDFTITIEQYVESDKYEPGYITDQTPKGNKTTRSLKEIKVKVVRDSESFVMGDFKGHTPYEMRKALSSEIKEYKITFDEVEEDSDDIEKGKIIKTVPTTGSKVKKGTTVTVYVSNGNMKMPDIIGCTLSDAKEILEKYKLSVGTLTPSDAEDTYVVIGQGIDPDETVTKGTKIDLELRAVDNPNSNDNNHEDQTSQGQTGSNTNVKSKVVTIVLPQDNESTTVKVVQDGRVIHNQTHNRTDGSIDVTVSGNGNSNIEIYFDGKYSSSMTVSL